MVYESDFYTTRRPYSRPLVSSYSITTPRHYVVRDYPEVGVRAAQEQYSYAYTNTSSASSSSAADPYSRRPQRTSRTEESVVKRESGPYGSYSTERSYRTSTGGGPGGYHSSYESHTSGPADSLTDLHDSSAEINRIRNLTRPSTESYTEKYLQSKDHIYFDDEAREIRARVDSLLRRVHVFIPRAVASDFAEEIVPERMRSGDYVRRLISGKQNAKKEAIEPISWYEVPDRGNFGNLACVKYVAGKPQSVRKPYFKVADLRPSDIKNDVNFLSYYSKNREAAANASQDVPMTERELRKARALQPDLDESTLRKAVETDKKTESKPEKKRESKREQAETKETKDEAAKTSVLEPVKEPEKEIRAEPERAKGPEVTSEIVAQPESVSEKEPESVKEPEPAKAPEREPVKEAKSLKRAKRAKEPEPAKEAKPSKEAEPAKKAEPVKESEGPTQEAEPAKEPVKEQEPAKQAETVDVPEPVKEPELETAKVAEPATRTESELTEEVEVAKEPESPATESAKSLESEIVRQSESETVQEPVSGLESKQEAIPETSSEPQTTEAVSQSGKTDEEATNENVKQEKEAAIKRIETYLVKAAEEARSQEEKTQAAEEERVRLELDELKAWEALQIAQERVAHLDEIVEQEQAEAQRQAEEEKLETQRLETERILEEEREIAEAKTTALLKQQEQAIIEEHLEKARQDEEKEERLANVTFDDADEVKDIDHSCDDVVTYDITDQEREERPYDPITDDDTRIEEEAHEEEHFELSEDPFVEEPEGAENRPVTGGNAVEESPKIEEVTSGGEESFEWGDENA